MLLQMEVMHPMLLNGPNNITKPPSKSKVSLSSRAGIQFKETKKKVWIQIQSWSLESDVGLMKSW